MTDRPSIEWLISACESEATIDGECSADMMLEISSLREKAEKWEKLIENVYRMKEGKAVIDEDEQVTAVIKALLFLGVDNA